MRAARMPVQPFTLVDSIRRELYLRVMAIPDLAALLGVTDRCMYARLAPPAGRAATKMQPVLLGLIVKALAITPRVARRLHYLAATEAGYDVAEAEPPSRGSVNPRARTQNRAVSAP